MFSKDEIRDIVISVLAITLVFAYNPSNPAKILFDFPFFLVIVIVAFLLHELSHRFVARKFGCAAFYKMWPGGIFFGILLMFTGLKFVAPGAVVIYPFMFGRWGYRRVQLTSTEMGLISVSGIAVNLIFAIIFLPLSGIILMDGMDLFATLSFVNAWLALFNLLPVPPLDGSKVFRWKTWLWLLLFVISILLVLPVILPGFL